METAIEQSKIEFSYVLDQLTEENQQEVLGVLEGLYFAQNIQEKQEKYNFK